MRSSGTEVEEAQGPRRSPPHTASRTHSPAAQDPALRAVQTALERKQQQEQVLCLQLQASQVEVARLREQLSERQQELRASRRLLQEQMREWEGLLNKLEVQSQEAQHYRAASELLGRCLRGWAGRAVPDWGGGSSPRPSMWEGEGHVSQTETALARPPAPPLTPRLLPPLPPPAVSPPSPHLLPPKSTQDSPSCPLHWHAKLSTLSPEQAVLSHLLPGSQDSSWGLLHLSKMVHKTPIHFPPRPLGWPVCPPGVLWIWWLWCS